MDDFSEQIPLPLEVWYFIQSNMTREVALRLILVSRQFLQAVLTHVQIVTPGVPFDWAHRFSQLRPSVPRLLNRYIPDLQPMRVTVPTQLLISQFLLDHPTVTGEYRFSLCGRGIFSVSPSDGRRHIVSDHPRLFQECFTICNDSSNGNDTYSLVRRNFIEHINRDEQVGGPTGMTGANGPPQPPPLPTTGTGATGPTGPGFWTAANQTGFSQLVMEMIADEPDHVGALIENVNFLSNLPMRLYQVCHKKLRLPRYSAAHGRYYCIVGLLQLNEAFGGEFNREHPGPEVTVNNNLSRLIGVPPGQYTLHALEQLVDAEWVPYPGDIIREYRGSDPVRCVMLLHPYQLE